MSLLPDLGPHSTFIWAAYAVVFVTLTCLAAWIMADEQRQRRLLTELEARGARRRSARPQSPAAPDAPANKPRAPAKSRRTGSARKSKPPSARQDKT